MKIGRVGKMVMAGAATAMAAASAIAANGVKLESALLRQPDVSAKQIVFAYANDLWVVDREGGMARPLASPPGPEESPRFSPDGSSIAFVGNYDGGRDIYTIATEGGIPTRVTHLPGAETLNDWTLQDTLLFSSSSLAGYRRIDQMFTVAPEGGMYDKLPVYMGSKGMISADGEWLVYTPYTRDTRTWKRYRGGWATDIWLFNLKTFESKKITDWEGTDTQPMWHGHMVYYLSDQGPEHRWNIWSYNTRDGARKQVTTFADYDCKHASMGPGPRGNGEIVLQNGADLYLLDLRSEKATKVEVRIPGARADLRADRKDVSRNITGADLSPSGKRVLVTARGDLWSLPAEKGATMPLTQSSGVNERDGAFSPDGKSVAYFSDETGEYELYVRPVDGGDARKLTNTGEKYKSMHAFSPDSKHILWTDNTGGYFLTEVETGTTQEIARDEWAQTLPTAWSHDSAWVALSLNQPNQQASLHLYEVATGTLTEVTSEMSTVMSPAFDRKGEFLYCVSPRSYTPILNNLPNDSSFTFIDTDVILAVPLRADVKSPLLPKADREEAKKDEEGKDDKKNGDEEKDGDEEDSKDEKKEEPKPPIKIDLDGFEMRAIQLPIDASNFSRLFVNSKNQLVYQRANATKAGSGGAPSVKLYDMHADEPKEETVVDEASVQAISGDGKQLLISKKGKRYVVEAAKDQKTEDAVPTDAMYAMIDPRAEWDHLLTDAWRLMRDYFYDAGMHGVDWPAARERYASQLDMCVVRDDVTFLIQEMISELNVGHAYYRPGSQEDEPSVDVGLLGCDYALENGAYRISRILAGGPWDSGVRSPLSEAGMDVHEGDYLLAVNGVPMDTSRDPWAAFVGLADKMVELTVSANPTMDGSARKVVVKTMSSDTELRMRDWIESNRRYVEEHSGGKVGYVYVRDVVFGGMTDMFRQFYGQVDKEALIIDDRWNAGGFVFLPGKLIEMLKRPRTNYWARRDGRDWPQPPDSHQGPKCMLINGLSASGGDLFPNLFRQAGLGPLIGMRTWGGLVGLSGNPSLVDGTSLSIPTFGFYDTDGTWGIEGHGVDPDIQVIEDPTVQANGRDPQIDAAIAYLLEELARRPYTPPAKPQGPNRSGMGLPDSDK